MALLCSIIWTPIPLLTWILPFIGHMGIQDSSGITHDFAGPYEVGIGQFAFGRPLRTLPLVGANAHLLDEAILHADEVYRQRMHNLFCDNCHSHVALALNRAAYDGRTTWGMVNLAVWMLLRGAYTDSTAVALHWAPFFVVVAFLATCALLL